MINIVKKAVVNYLVTWGVVILTQITENSGIPSALDIRSRIAARAVRFIVRRQMCVAYSNTSRLYSANSVYNWLGFYTGAIN